MNGKWLKNGMTIYAEAIKDNWRFITKEHDGITMPEHWERKAPNGDWEFKDAYDGSGYALGPGGEKMMKLW